MKDSDYVPHLELEVMIMIGDVYDIFPVKLSNVGLVNNLRVWNVLTKFPETFIRITHKGTDYYINKVTDLVKLSKCFKNEDQNGFNRSKTNS